MGGLLGVESVVADGVAGAEEVIFKFDAAGTELEVVTATDVRRGRRRVSGFWEWRSTGLKAPMPRER